MPLQARPESLDTRKEGIRFKTGSWNREFLTGGWGGLRDRISDHGIDFEFSYTREILGNLTGGLETGVGFNGLIDLGVNLDLDKLTRRWKGGRFRVSAIIPHGNGISPKVGDVQGVSNIEAHDSSRLYELFIAQSLWEDRLAIKAGNLLADHDFSVTSYGEVFVNSSFGWPAFISLNTLNTGPAFYAAAPGAHLKIRPCEHWYFQTGVYDGDSLDDPAGDPEVNASGVQWELSGDQGAFLMAETGYRLNPDDAAGRLPGTYKLGGWYHTAPFTKFETGNATRGNYGVYVSSEQLLWREPDQPPEGRQGLGAFFRIGFSPDDRNMADYALDTGLNYRGLFPGRDQDTIGLGAALAHASDPFRDLQRNHGAAFPDDHEWALEFTYKFALAPWFTLQPTFQWINNPGMSGELDDAFVIGLRSKLTF